MRKSRADTGFSLLEMVIALAILSLVSGIAIVSLGPRRGAAALAAQAHELALWLEQQRGRSLVSHKPRTVWIRQALDNASHGAESDEHESKLLAGKTPPITFYPDGETSGARITLATGGRSATVTVDSLTGRIAVVEP